MQPHEIYFILIFFDRKFRLKWPWEQDRQMAIYNRSSQFIQVASQPERVFMTSRAGYTDGWCLSHLPEAGCFFSHYCANARSKQVMRSLYQLPLNVTSSAEEADETQREER